MGECEICGARLDCECRARIDGVVFSVCRSCAKMGQEIVISTVCRPRPKPARELVDDSSLVDSFGAMIKAEREKRGLSREQLAAAIGETASVIKRAEHGLQPGDKSVRKLEKLLGVRLLESATGFASSATEKRTPLTLGDVAEVRQRKRETC